VRLTGALQSPGELGRHDLYDQTDSNAQHLVEQLRLSTDEHCQIDENLLRNKKYEKYNAMAERACINVSKKYSIIYDKPDSQM